MKNNRVKNAVGAINRDQKDIAQHVAHLNDSEKRRALMAATSFALRAGYNRVVKESLQELGFRDEEVLVFASAAIAGGRPYLVPMIVKSFCRDTSIAKSELGHAVRNLIDWAELNKWPNLLSTALECIEMMREEIGAPYSLTPNRSTRLAGHVLWLIEDMLSQIPGLQKEHDLIVLRLRKMVHDDDCWKRLQKEKRRLGGPRE